jgi:hypothetical protein
LDRSRFEGITSWISMCLDRVDHFWGCSQIRSFSIVLWTSLNLFQWWRHFFFHWTNADCFTDHWNWMWFFSVSSLWSFLRWIRCLVTRNDRLRININQ